MKIENIFMEKNIQSRINKYTNRKESIEKICLYECSFGLDYIERMKKKDFLSCPSPRERYAKIGPKYDSETEDIICHGNNDEFSDFFKGTTQLINKELPKSKLYSLDYKSCSPSGVCNKDLSAQAMVQKMGLTAGIDPKNALKLNHLQKKVDVQKRKIARIQKKFMKEHEMKRPLDLVFSEKNQAWSLTPNPPSKITGRALSRLRKSLRPHAKLKRMAELKMESIRRDKEKLDRERSARLEKFESSMVKSFFVARSLAACCQDNNCRTEMYDSGSAVDFEIDEIQIEQ